MKIMGIWSITLEIALGALKTSEGISTREIKLFFGKYVSTFKKLQNGIHIYISQSQPRVSKEIKDYTWLGSAIYPWEPNGKLVTSYTPSPMNWR